MADRDAFIVVNCRGKDVRVIREALHALHRIDTRAKDIEAADFVVYEPFSGREAEQWRVMLVAGHKVATRDARTSWNKIYEAWTILMGERK